MHNRHGRFIRLLVMPVIILLASCTPLQLSRAGIDLSSDEGQTLLALPDYQPNNCVWVQKGLEARGFKYEAIVYSVYYADRESDCCPTKAGGDMVDGGCQPTGEKGSWRYDPSDTGVLQFNGYSPGGGTRDQTPARKFCSEGVQRFKDERWTGEVSYPCNQWDVLADPELQLDMLTKLVDDCGFGPWRPINGQYGCWNYTPFV